MTEKYIKVVKTQNRIVLPKEFKEGDIVEIKRVIIKEELKKR